MPGLLPFADDHCPHHATARAAVRAFVAARCPAALAAGLLPPAPGERAREFAPPPTLDLPDFATLAAHYPSLLADPHRKQRGTWYTPDALVAPTVARALAPLLAGRSPNELATLRICDPATGGGTFLVAALRELVRHGLDAPRAAHCLFGVDVDETAAAIAVLAIHEACGRDAPDLTALAAHIRTGDGLTELREGSFDAVLTNPPWETLQATPESRERTAALRPRFRHQGRGKLYTYRLFGERAYQLLHDGGRFGLVVPASLWFDRDAGPLRELLLERCEWEWLFGFENQRKVFAIDNRYRFAVITGQKGGATANVRTAFGRVDPADWATPEPRHVDYPVPLLSLLSPRHRTFVEVEHPRDLAILARMARHGRPLTGRDGAFAWRQGDFNMTADRGRFVLRSDAEAAGFVRGAAGSWRRGREELLPLYQGAMLYDLHPNTGAHREGTGHATSWEAPADENDLRPQYLVPAAPWRAGAAGRPPARIGLRALSNATNERSAIACLLPDVPCGNSLGVLTPRAPTATPLCAMAAGAAVLGSLPFDWALRRRLSGTNLNHFVLDDCVLPRLDAATEGALARLALQLCCVLPWHGALWQRAAAEGSADGCAPATEPARRRALLTAIDVLVGQAFGLEVEDVAWITGDEGPRGFRRVDRSLPAAARRPRRWLLQCQDGRDQRYV